MNTFHTYTVRTYVRMYLSINLLASNIRTCVPMYMLVFLKLFIVYGPLTGPSGCVLCWQTTLSLGVLTIIEVTFVSLYSCPLWAGGPSVDTGPLYWVHTYVHTYHVALNFVELNFRDFEHEHWSAKSAHLFDR